MGNLGSHIILLGHSAKSAAVAGDLPVSLRERAGVRGCLDSPPLTLLSPPGLLLSLVIFLSVFGNVLVCVAV